MPRGGNRGATWVARKQAAGVKRRGRSIAFVGAEVATVSGKLLAEGNMAYRIVLEVNPQDHRKKD